MTSTPISEKDVAEMRALFDSVGEAESYLTRRLRNVGRGLLALASQSQERDAEIRRAAIEECGKIVSRHLHSPEAILQAFQDIAAQQREVKT